MRLTSMSLRSAAVPAIALSTAAVLGLSLGACGTNDSTDGVADGSFAEEFGIDLPDTPVGRQMAWFISAVPQAPLSEELLSSRFTEEFLSQVPVDDINNSLLDFGRLNPVSIERADEFEMMLIVTAGEERLNLAMSVDENNDISGLTLTPAGPERPDSPESWDEFDDRLDALAPDSTFVVASVDGDGMCVPVREKRGDDVMPIASVFKLYVLDAVAGAVERGDIEWETTMAVTDELKSWPTGILQDEQAGTEVSVGESVELMMALSDNTATDMLIDLVGAEAVEDSIAASSRNAERNQPLLTTRDMFILKAVDYPSLADEFVGLDADQRRDFLATTLSETQLPPLSEAQDWTTPRHIDSIEWFGSAEDVCAAYVGLSQRDSEMVDRALSQNDGGIGLDREEFPTVWFKGGSEPGILALSYLVETPEGDRFVISINTRDERADITDSRVTTTDVQEALSLAEGALRLATS
ncbi:serine hydrolase [Hoyosella rhizosphaerae]|uniref:Serine hydrolase n=1 Tax=Hoyosella rhizosphaerae TaxID=1755582 RepID=A0A916U1G2_9ACTN|nr:serine hydrolase [Hoyosella rhizosphaerae]MBN4926692.1 serine hydrolase [Hoyosella rhizosphaerae]GGC57150.1 hypothetical protein GCM10011410_07140 [Hoyosella rhizosphaerae]